MTDFQAIADRVEIEALRGEFTDAVMTRDVCFQLYHVADIDQVRLLGREALPQLT